MKPKQPIIFNINQNEIDNLKHLQKLLNDHKFLQVIQEGRKARNKYPKNFFFYTIPSIAYSLTNRLEDAFQLLKDAEQKFPDSYEVLYQLAKIHEEIKEYDDAEKYYKKSYEVTHADYNDARAECLNDLGVLYWKMHRKDEALESWKLALSEGSFGMEDPKNIMAQNNLRDFTNEYGKPSSVSPLMDDVFHFRNIQMEKYLQSKNLTEFQSMEETDKIIQLISDSWNRNIAPERERLDSSSALEKTKWFESIEIDFSEGSFGDAEPSTKEEKSKLFKSLKTKSSGPKDPLDKSKSKKRNEKPPLRGKKFSEEEKAIEEFKRKFPFLPEDGLIYTTIASPFLFKAGFEPDRLREIIKEGTQDEGEQDMLLWAYDIGSNLFYSVIEEDEEEAEDLLYEALDIAAEFLDEDEIEEAFEMTTKIIQSFAEILENEE